MLSPRGRDEKDMLLNVKAPNGMREILQVDVIKGDVMVLCWGVPGIRGNK